MRTVVDIFDMRQINGGTMSNPNVTTDPVGPASADEQREELRARYPDVIRVAAGLAASTDWARDWAAAGERPPASWDGFAEWCASGALAIVRACEAVCGIGGDA